VFERPEGLAQDLKKYQEKEFFVLNKCVCDWVCCVCVTFQQSNRLKD
jgi:hypothetical protein